MKMPEPLFGKIQTPVIKTDKVDKLTESFQTLQVNGKTKPTPQTTEPKKLTPYQGKRRSFGWFRCVECKKNWSSASSWANTFQKCQTCFREIYPYRQAKLDRKGEKLEGRPPHQQALCGKCLARGSNCMAAKIQ